MFTEEQIKSLDAHLDGNAVKQRQQGGMKLSYIEGWWAIKEANRIFGHGNWDRATVMMECVWSGERETRNGPKPDASYIARVRILVRGKNGETVIREGTGAGSGFGGDAGEAHESASKEAETDAMKRALMTFGNPFGLALYDKDQAEVSRGLSPKGDDTPIKTSGRPDERTGPLGKTALFRSLKNLETALTKKYRNGDVDGFLETYTSDDACKVMDQAAKDMPVEWSGPNPDGGENYRDAFERMRSELQDAHNPVMAG